MAANYHKKFFSFLGILVYVVWCIIQMWKEKIDRMTNCPLSFGKL